MQTSVVVHSISTGICFSLSVGVFVVSVRGDPAECGEGGEKDGNTDGQEQRNVDCKPVKQDTECDGVH